MKRLIIYAATLILATLSANAQEVFRTFDYQSPEMEPATAEAKTKISAQLRSLLQKKTTESARAAKIIAAYEANDKATLKTMKVKYDDVNVDKLTNVLGDTILLDSEKIDAVVNAMGTDKVQLAAIGKAFVDEGDFMSADAVVRTLMEKHPRYAYTNMLSAYNHQALGISYGKANDRSNKNTELNGAAMQLEEIAESAKDSLEIYRNLLMTAGCLRYEAQEEGMCRTDFDEVLKLQPSMEDSLDIAVMLAYFDRMQAAEAMNNGEHDLAMEYYEKAIASYGNYLNSTSSLPHDIYTSEAVDGYLFCKSNRAAILREKNEKNTSAYNDLLAEANRFLSYNNNDIRTHRYKLRAYFQMCNADSTQFRSLRDEYLQSMAYVTGGQFVDSLYTYEDYNMTQRGATWAGDDALRAQYLKKSVAAYDGEDGSIKGELLAALVNTEKRNGNYMAEIAARKQQIEEVLKVDPNGDIGGNELNLAQAYFNVIAAEKENRTLPLDTIYSYAEIGNTFLNKYVNSSNEDYAAHALQQKYNAMVDMLASAEGDYRTHYYETYRDEMLEKIAWCKENDFSNVQRHTRNLFLVTYNYILTTKNQAELPAVAGSAYKLFYNEFEGEPDTDVRPEIAAAYLGNIDSQLRGRIQELKADENVLTAVCDTLDSYMLGMNHGQAADATLQQEQYSFYANLRQDYVLGAVSDDYQKTFDRTRFLSNHAAIQDKGHTSYLPDFVSANKSGRFYHENIVSKNDDLTATEKLLVYSALATSYYSTGVDAYQAYISRKSNDNRDKALADLELAYYYSAKAVKMGNGKYAGNVNTLEDVKFAAPAVEKAQERLAIEDAEEMERAAQAQQAQQAAEAQEQSATEEGAAATEEGAATTEEGAATTTDEQSEAEQTTDAEQTTEE